MRRYQLRAALLWAILALSGLGLLLAAFSLKSNLMPWAVALFLAVCLAVQVLLYRTAGAYMRELVCQLSDLIDQLTQLREDPVFRLWRTPFSPDSSSRWSGWPPSGRG